jgi:hypothetical protein
VAEFKVLSRHLTGGTEDPRKTSVRTSGRHNEKTNQSDTYVCHLLVLPKVKNFPSDLTNSS